MNDNVSDLIKADEKAWYARKADMRKNHVSWLDFYPEYLKTPYKKYISYFERREKQSPDILELCCKTGNFPFGIECLRFV